MTTDQRPFKEVRANRFVLEDENGKTRVTLGMDGDTPELILFGENENLRLSICAGEDGPGLILYGDKGEFRLGICTGENGPGLVLFNERGEAIWEAPQPETSYMTKKKRQVKK
jgi:hypothetical protein